MLLRLVKVQKMQVPSGRNGHIKVYYCTWSKPMLLEVTAHADQLKPESHGMHDSAEADTPLLQHQAVEKQAAW